MTYLPPVESPELLTKSEFNQFKTEMREFRTAMLERFDRMENEVNGQFKEVNKRIDRVLLAVVGGLFVMVAALIGTGAFS